MLARRLRWRCWICCSHKCLGTSRSGWTTCKRCTVGWRACGFPTATAAGYCRARSTCCTLRRTACHFGARPQLILAAWHTPQIDLNDTTVQEMRLQLRIGLLHRCRQSVMAPVRHVPHARADSHGFTVAAGAAAVHATAAACVRAHACAAQAVKSAATAARSYRPVPTRSARTRRQRGSAGGRGALDAGGLRSVVRAQRELREPAATARTHARTRVHARAPRTHAPCSHAPTGPGTDLALVGALTNRQLGHVASSCDWRSRVGVHSQLATHHVHVRCVLLHVRAREDVCGPRAWQIAPG